MYVRIKIRHHDIKFSMPKTKIWTCAKNNVAQKEVFHCRQKQDDDPQKNILCSKKLIFFGIARHSFIVKKVVCSKFYLIFYQGIG